MARRPDEEEESGWETAAKIAVGVTAAAVGIGAIIGAMSRVTTETQHQPHSSYTVHEPSSDEEEHPWAYAGRAVPGWSLTRQEPRALAGQAAITCNSHYQGSESAIILSRPKISNINTLLDKIYIHHIHLKKEEFEEHYRVFQDMFRRLNEAMKDVDPYYRRYSSMKEFAGSHYDGLRIIKPDEIDVDIVIRLPANMCMDVGLEPRAPGYVQLRMGTQFQKLPYREDFHINMTAHKWMDERHYLLRSRFLYWFRGVVDRALNCFPKNNYGQHYSRIGDMVHTISTSGGGPAVTLIIENETGFKLNVDLVPAIRFPEERWPICRGYREIPPNCKRGDINRNTPKA